ncbi:MAG: hypothetical protein A2133_04875 [Actinobacteria bacterium RBG_16_64_13]|nr:MAG: hypothetical protein A2133_04875 [Actinobacteria bacterium RBG_16_64_13]
MPRLLLVNPSNSLVNMARTSRSHLSRRYRVWKPLGLMVLAGLTPDDWEISIVDENLGVPDYKALPRPDLVGLTAFTSQAPRAYALAAEFRGSGVPVVIGGVHASMRREEAGQYVDAVVTGEAEGIWATVLADARLGQLKPLYEGGWADLSQAPLSRHDLLPPSYAFGAVQTTRGCPLHCNFCSVTAFNGARYRERPIADVVREFSLIKEKLVFVVDDNLIGTTTAQLNRAKDLFRALAAAKLGKHWITQTTVNFADDEELLRLAAKAGCVAVFIGFESPTAEGLVEVRKRFNLRQDRDFAASVRRIHRHRIMVVGSFMIGLGVDEPGIGRQVAETSVRYGLDNINIAFLTPLPGTALWDEMSADGGLPLDRFPDDWKYYTLTYPAARYRHLSLDEAIDEMVDCNRIFYSPLRLLGRMTGSVLRARHPLFNGINNLASRRNSRLLAKGYADFRREEGHRY